MSTNTAVRHFLAKAFRMLRVSLERIRTLPLKRRLSRSAEYQFTSNWGEPFVATWSRCLSEFKGKEDVRMLEIGSYEGRSAIWFLANILTHGSATLTCIDPFFRRTREIRFDHNLRFSGRGKKVTKIKARSDDVLYKMPRDSFDIIYIDGDHQAKTVLMDAISGWLCLKPGGVMILDDYQWKPEKPASDRPQIAIDMVLASLANQIEVLHQDYQVIVRKRRTRSIPA